jgi:alpha-tubulin suppressor-like RCC1 family protein
MAPLTDEQTGGVGDSVSNGLWLYRAVTVPTCPPGFTLYDWQTRWYSEAEDFHGNKVWSADGVIDLKPAAPAPPVPSTKPCETVSQIVANETHTCVLHDDGTVHCWGDNSGGELGDGTYVTPRTTPVAVLGISGAIQITAGRAHTCALLGDGTVRCWGSNEWGQLGAGDTAARLTPVTVSGLANVSQISAGWAYTCALLRDGTVRCWGYYGFGAGGDGTLPMEWLTPVQMLNLSGVVQIAAGNAHTCALLRSGTVRCWGSNGSGRLGDGTLKSRFTAVDVPGLGGVTQITAGRDGSCALLRDFTARCWGANSDGGDGDGTSTDRISPTVVPELVGVMQISRRSGACATLGDGTARCWGVNYHGQLGDGTLIDRLSPVPVAGISSAIQIADGGAHTCVLLRDRSVRCWGDNTWGELGDGSTTHRGVAASVAPFTCGATSLP